MDKFVALLKLSWLSMLEPPWRDPAKRLQQRIPHWSVWILGWAWTLTGLVGGALVAPALVKAVGLANTSYQDWMEIAIAVAAGFFVQLLGWIIAWPLILAVLKARKANMPSLLRVFLGVVTPNAGGLALALPSISVGYGIYRYLTLIGPVQREVTVAFVGSLLIKTFIIPAIWSAVKSKAFQAFMRWLRGDQVKKA